MTSFRIGSVRWQTVLDVQQASIAGNAVVLNHWHLLVQDHVLAVVLVNTKLQLDRKCAQVAQGVQMHAIQANGCRGVVVQVQARARIVQHVQQINTWLTVTAKTRDLVKIVQRPVPSDSTC